MTVSVMRQIMFDCVSYQQRASTTHGSRILVQLYWCNTRLDTHIPNTPYNLTDSFYRSGTWMAREGWWAAIIGKNVIALFITSTEK